MPTSAGAVDTDASTARSLTLVAMILQIVFFTIGILIVSIFFFVTAVVTTGDVTIVQNGTTVTSAFPVTSAAVPTFAFGILGLVFTIGFVISVVWVVLDYFLIYRNLHSPDTIPNARTPALVLGILQLLFAGFIPGILLIVAYLKIGDSMRRRGQIYEIYSR